ncbi:cAMP-dependent protein kinase inhibitor gamma isoform X1 [Harpia harpyja]|uniref:cAMP-dependent protein kinase inhibitor gamma isoform X1 n=1 Tax=Harpia harpyja TaxID=202280 RepID=UPI0022B1E298|nr:cAMP-dependent protein kinase inhibitor gamma isoform X1 [Harpia harpyja]
MSIGLQQAGTDSGGENTPLGPRSATSFSSSQYKETASLKLAATPPASLAARRPGQRRQEGEIQPRFLPQWRDRGTWHSRSSGSWGGQAAALLRMKLV